MLLLFLVWPWQRHAMETLISDKSLVVYAVSLSTVGEYLYVIMWGKWCNMVIHLIVINENRLNTKSIFGDGPRRIVCKPKNTQKSMKRNHDKDMLFRSLYTYVSLFRLFCLLFQCCVSAKVCTLQFNLIFITFCIQTNESMRQKLEHFTFRCNHISITALHVYTHTFIEKWQRKMGAVVIAARCVECCLMDVNYEQFAADIFDARFYSLSLDSFFSLSYLAILPKIHEMFTFHIYRNGQR